MIGGWMMAEVVAIFATGAAGAIASSVGRSPARAAVAIGIGVMTFCVAGVFVAGWWYHAARNAAREARLSGITSARYLHLNRQARSSAVTLWYQGILGAIVAVLVFLK
jgi:CHASE2 domain-containing sensor protein